MLHKSILPKGGIEQIDNYEGITRDYMFKTIPLWQKIFNPAYKLTQIRLDLEQYNFEIEHIAGTTNVVANTLYRIHIDDLKTMHVETAKTSVTIDDQNIMHKRCARRNKNKCWKMLYADIRRNKPQVIKEYARVQDSNEYNQ